MSHLSSIQKVRIQFNPVGVNDLSNPRISQELVKSNRDNLLQALWVCILAWACPHNIAVAVCCAPGHNSVGQIKIKRSKTSGQSNRLATPKHENAVFFRAESDQTCVYGTLRFLMRPGTVVGKSNPSESYHDSTTND